MGQNDLSLKPGDKKKLEGLGVAILYLFGSRAEEKAAEHSDVDFGVVMRNPSLLSQGTNEIYLVLFNLLGNYVENSNDLDIIFLQKAPLELRFDVIRHGKPIWEVSSDFRLDFEEAIMRAYCDFKPVLNEFDQAILEG
jgi:predicted nucleotidyltransferase